MLGSKVSSISKFSLLAARKLIKRSMTWAWLYLVLGTLLRKFEMSLHDTTERNVEMVRDKFIGQTECGMNRVQIKVLGEYD